MRHIMKISLGLSIAMMGGLACASAAQVKQDTLIAAENSQGYSKPGASVRLSHNFSGKINPGQVGDMTVNFIMPPTDGRVQVSFAATDGLDLLSGGDKRETLLQKSAFANTQQPPMAPQFLQFRAQNDGVYYVNAFIDVFYEGGQKRSRVLTIPVSVGTGASKPINTGIELDNSSGRNIAVMRASETIDE